jgi:acetoin utilization deacetylase AcuC-like enzyme
MARTGFFTHDDFLRHESAGGSHPESPQRLLAARAGIEPFLGDLAVVGGRPATVEELALVHTSAHIEVVQQCSERGPGQLDPDTYVNHHSYVAARLAVGGALSMVDALAEGRIDRGLVLARPPGHHATPSHAMGFCLFNSVAVAARYAQKRHGVERVLVVDWDAHHGNGTQDTFWGDGTVGYFSVHQYPYYPGTGAAREVGEGAGEGYTVNVPVAAGTGDKGFLASLAQLWPLWDRLDPGLIIVSAGFDAHIRDPLVQLEVTTEGFRQVVAELCGRAGTVPTMFVMEGGYAAVALTEGWRAVAEGCLET